MSKTNKQLDDIEEELLDCEEDSQNTWGFNKIHQK
jgi:hypothetical protein